MPTSPAFDLDAFGRRHIGTTPHDHEWMLAALGYDSLDALMTANAYRTEIPRLEAEQGQSLAELEMLTGHPLVAATLEVGTPATGGGHE